MMLCIIKYSECCSLFLWASKASILARNWKVFWNSYTKWHTFSKLGKIRRRWRQTTIEDNLIITLFSFRMHLRVFWWYKRTWQWCKNVEHEDVDIWCLLLWACTKHHFLMFIARRKNLKTSIFADIYIETWKPHFWCLLLSAKIENINFWCLLNADL